MLNPQILFTRRTPKQRIDILKRYVRSLWNPISRPHVRSETGRREDKERDPSIQDRLLGSCDHEVLNDSRGRGLKEDRGHKSNQN